MEEAELEVLFERVILLLLSNIGSDWKRRADDKSDSLFECARGEKSVLSVFRNVSAAILKTLKCKSTKGCLLTIRIARGTSITMFFVFPFCK